MFNVKFDKLEQAMKLNEMTEMQLVHHLKRYFENQNYREDYNKRKNALTNLLKDDPIVKERMKVLKSASK